MTGGKGEARKPAENPIQLLAIDHVVIRVVSLERMIDFYCDVLGCHLERDPEEFGFAGLRAGASLIDLVAASSPIGMKGGGAPDHSVPNMDHVCLQVDATTLDAIQLHLKQRGIEIGEVATRYGATGYGPSLYLQDPENNTVELKGVSVT